MLTTRPLPASRRSVPATVSTGAETAAGVSAPVSTSTTAPNRSPSAVSGLRRTSTSQPDRTLATASASAAEASSDTTRTGPTVSGLPGR